MAKRRRPSFVPKPSITPAEVRKGWENQVIKLYACLDKLAASKSVHGGPWVDGMIKHYERKLDDLYDNEPPV